MKVVFTSKADKSLSKFDKRTKEQIINYLQDIEAQENPRAKGKALTGNLKGLWSYRKGDYRIICDILDDRLIVLVIHLAHRKEVYKG